MPISSSRCITKAGTVRCPCPDNAIYRLATALERLSRYSFPLKTDEVTRAYFRQMAKVEEGSLKDDLAKVADGSPEAVERCDAARGVRFAALEFDAAHYLRRY